MHGALGMVGRELVVLAHVDEVEPLATVQLGLHLGDRAFFDVRLCFFNQFQKPRIVLHRSLTYSIPQAYLSLSLPEHSAAGKMALSIIGRLVETDADFRGGPHGYTQDHT